MKRRLSLRVGNEDFEVIAERNGDSITIERDGQTHTVQLISDSVVAPVGKPAPAPAPRPAAPAPAAPRPAAPAAPSPGAGPAGPGAITAPMVGVVKSVEVAEGATVAAGDKVVILEAMKMDIDVVAASAGTVAEVNVAAGQNVSEGQQLVRIDSGSGA
jgi:biotin carboxyl carrier protein